MLRTPPNVGGLGGQSEVEGRCAYTVAKVGGLGGLNEKPQIITVRGIISLLIYAVLFNFLPLKVRRAVDR